MALYQNYAKEILSKLGRLNELIRHAPSIGSFHESFISNYLKNFLPRRFSIKTGFVYNPTSREVSPQIDILVIDENVPSSYLFQDGDFVVVTPSSVVCAIEIKTNFDKNSLRDIASKTKLYRKVNPYPINNFLALCFKTKTKNIETIGNWYKSIDAVDNWLDYPKEITVLDLGSFRASSEEQSIPFGVLRIVCNENSQVDKAESLLTNFLFSIMKLCELRDGKHFMDTINTVFQGDFDKLFILRHECFRYSIGKSPLVKHSLMNGKVIYKSKKS